MQNWTKALIQNASVRDEYYDNVVSLLHFDGTDGSTTFDDEKGKIWTPTGAVEIDTAVKQFGVSSCLFSGGRVSTPHSTGLDFGSGDFTIEFFIRRDSMAAIRTLLDKRASVGGYAPFLIRLDAAHRVQVYLSLNNSAWDISAKLSTDTTTLNQFDHVAIVRGGSGVDIFLRGIKQGSTSPLTGSLMASTADLILGRDPIGNNPFSGHIDDLRVTKGIARYTSNFTPPIKPFPDR